MTAPKFKPGVNKRKHRPPSNPEHHAKYPRGDGGLWKTKLTPALQEKILKNVRLGIFDKQIAALSGIHYDTLRLWIEKGEVENAVEPYLSFAAKYRAATIEHHELKYLNIIFRAAEGEPIKKNKRPADWQAAKFYLRCRFPKRYNPQDASTPPDALEIEAKRSKRMSALEAIRNQDPELLKLVEEAGYKFIPLSDEEKAVNLLGSDVVNDEPNKE